MIELKLRRRCKNRGQHHVEVTYASDSASKDDALSERMIGVFT